MTTLKTVLDELGVHVDTQLFELAFAHRSWAYENGQVQSNERLEFLGDAVLQIVVTEHIYLSYPDLSEGQMAKLRSSVVSSEALARVAAELDLGSLIRLGKGELATGGSTKRSILADACEAVIGAIHLSAGAAGSARFIHHIFDPLIEASQADGDYADHKTILQEACAANGWAPPVYQITGSGPDHERTFAAVVLIDGEVMGEGTATSKKRAEQIAARHAAAGLVERRA